VIAAMTEQRQRHGRRVGPQRCVLGCEVAERRASVEHGGRLVVDEAHVVDEFVARAQDRRFGRERRQHRDRDGDRGDRGGGGGARGRLGRPRPQPSREACAAADRDERERERRGRHERRHREVDDVRRAPVRSGEGRRALEHEAAGERRDGERFERRDEARRDERRERKRPAGQLHRQRGERDRRQQRDQEARVLRRLGRDHPGDLGPEAGAAAGRQQPPQRWSEHEHRDDRDCGDDRGRDPHGDDRCAAVRRRGGLPPHRRVLHDHPISPRTVFPRESPL
jgi:hypothetical protein